MGTYDELPAIFKKDKSVAIAEHKQLNERVSAVVSELAEQYPAWARADVQAMDELLTRAGTADDKECYRLLREDFFRRAHDIKGQGATFDYPLMTELGAVVCDYLRHKTAFDETDLACLRGFVADMRFVLDNRLTGEGGEKAQSIHRKLTKE